MFEDIECDGYIISYTGYLVGDMGKINLDYNLIEIYNKYLLFEIRLKKSLYSDIGKVMNTMSVMRKGGMSWTDIKAYYEI